VGCAHDAERNQGAVDRSARRRCFSRCRSRMREADAVARIEVGFSTAYRASTYAAQMVGKPYRTGGAAPVTGFDCSGAGSSFSFRQAGVILPRSHRGATTGRRACSRVTSAARRFAVFRPSGQEELARRHLRGRRTIRAPPSSASACARIGSTRPTGGSTCRRRGGSTLRRLSATRGPARRVFDDIVVLARGWPNAIQPWPRSVKSSRCRRISLSPSAVRRCRWCCVLQHEPVLAPLDGAVLAEAFGSEMTTLAVGPAPDHDRVVTAAARDLSRGTSGAAPPAQACARRSSRLPR